MENSNLLAAFGNSAARVKNAIFAIRAGRGVLLVNDENR